MFGLSFDTAAPVERAHPARADIALFVGWTTRRAGTPLPPPIAAWLAERRYRADDALRDVPVPIDTWAVFDALFDWHARPVAPGAAERADDYLGLAVRDFFANGGRKAYVVRLGDPWPVEPQIDGADRAAARRQLLPLAGASGWMRESWRGIEHAWALDDLSFVLVPDLPDLFGDPRRPVPGDEPQAPAVPEVFVECAASQAAPEPPSGVRRIAAPRLGDDSFAAWNDTARELRDRLARRRRDLMLLLALPLAAADARAAHSLRDVGRLRTGLLQSSMVQIAAPWLQPLRASRTPAGLVPGDGALAGLIAAGVLAQGAARTVAGSAPAGVLAVLPQPRDEHLRTPPPGREHEALGSQLSLFAPTPNGVRLLSDVSRSAQRGWQPAGVVRLIGQLLRSARELGETLVFEPSGEALWTRVRSRFQELLTRWWQIGALRGATAAEAFDLQCDRGTMSQADLDHGRVVVLLSFQPQLSIERIRVALALAEDGRIGLEPADAVLETQP